MKSSLESSFAMTDEGLSYAVYGSSVISQSRLYDHSVFEMSDLPEGATVIKAFLYWSGELDPSKSADTKVELKGPDGRVTVIHAERVWTNVVSGLVYVSKAEVSRYLKAKGTYEISHIDADPLEPGKTASGLKKKATYTLGGWGLVVVFKDPHIKSAAHIQIYDGLLYLPSGESQREGKFGLTRLGHTVEKKTLYPETVVKIQGWKPAQPGVLDLAVICGFGRPWDAGSVLVDGAPLTGQEDFAGNAGFSWDVNRDLVFLKKTPPDAQHEIEFLPDYNSIMPVAVVAKFGSPQKDEILRLAASYANQAARIDHMEFFGRGGNALEGRESSVKEYLKGLLNAKAIGLFETVKGMEWGDPYDIHLALGQLYFEKNLLDLAEMELKEAARSGKPDAQASISLGQLYYKRGEIEEAIRCFLAAKEISGGNLQVAQDLGICFMQRGLLKEAAAQFEEAIRLDPRDPTPYRCLSSIYGRQGRLARKVAILKRMEAAREGPGR